MGGQYRITGDKYPRMRRPRGRRRLVFLVVASVTALGLIGWGTLQLIDVFTGKGDKATAAGAKDDCTSKAGPSAKATTASTTSTAAGTLPRPGQITVNVLNATPRSGLAKQTADELKKRGFRIGDVGNATATYDKKVNGAGILLGAKGAAQAALPVLGTQLSGAEVKTDGRAQADRVDLIIGTSFKSLTKKEDADKALATLSGPQPAASASPKNC
ncbi:LytR C-terminal domain-containing protein [Streptomyces sp. NPDC059697]|uniref:LytR C-terminal domain-containing protein n=1 Tax=Streptomyces TaxID=1883 RepID=UPI00143E1C21|nr:MULTISPECIES: LytR C-terminal domain-containing protein [Streptomyces]QIY77073.1 LytR C-terminal domain-containing protein [Streptomyces sp. RLB1-33]QUW84974.1 LytR C-terminal domain-containing protein [Streptomyces mirabilis]